MNILWTSRSEAEQVMDTISRQDAMLNSLMEKQATLESAVLQLDEKLTHYLTQIKPLINKVLYDLNEVWKENHVMHTEQSALSESIQKLDTQMQLQMQAWEKTKSELIQQSSRSLTEYQTSQQAVSQDITEIREMLKILLVSGLADEIKAVLK